MPSKIIFETENIGMEGELDISAGSTKPKKVKEKKTMEGKKIKKHKTVVEEEPDCEPPVPKKKKKEKVDKANGDVNKSIDVNGNIESHLKNNTSYSNEESADNDKATEKKKTSEEVVVNRVLPKTLTLIVQTNGHSTTTTPAHSSEDSGSDGEKEIETPEQKEGAFSNFRISPNTIKLLQVDAIRSGIDVLVGTPGRIKDHLQNNKLDLSQLKHVVLDEVDQMLDMGFAEQVEEILSASYQKDSESNPQTLLFSATCPPWVYVVAKKYMRPTYEHVDLIGKKTQKAATTVEHLAIACHWSQRAAVIGDVVQVYSGSHGRTIVFCETKKDANELSMNTSIKQSSQSLHGDIPQKQREITLKGFRSGTFEVLVATNVAARGLDIPEVDLVVQCSPPKDVESYIHRSGRTGRAGRAGVCICFYQRKEEDQLRYVEQKAGITFKRVGVPTPSDIIKSSSKDAVRFLDSVPPQAIEYFRVAATKLIEERGAVDSLAAALAHISGATALEQRSLLNSDAGYTTMTMNCSQELHNIGCAWRGLKEQLGEEIDDVIRGMTFLKGKMGVCFDVPADKVKEYQDAWQDGRRWQLSIATELPELEEKQRMGGDRGYGRSFSGRGGGGRGGGHGFRNGGGGGGNWRGGGGSHKRSFSSAFDY
ncbi:nucleolar RNA helicase 2-like isoform X2 [Oncorhynchus kisutch]|uniref:nucleolar RNA helicase 2-like isoform X2 n=1 Tax=Oncorhynchus kisutch TaxID=8019 RepID=UPI0009A006AD|nr:nucleolar RNA helicase 2-like isoform X2 [Oncorhynchus kisutch]